MYSGNYQIHYESQSKWQTSQNRQGTLSYKVCQYLPVVKDEKQRKEFQEIFLDILQRVSSEKDFYKQLYRENKNLASRYYKWRRRQRINVKKAKHLIEIDSLTNEQSQDQQDIIQPNQNEIKNFESSTNYDHQSYSINRFNEEMSYQYTSNMQSRQNCYSTQQVEHNIKVDLSSIDSNKSEQIDLLLKKIEDQNSNLADFTQGYILNIRQTYQTLNDVIKRINHKNKQLKEL